MLTIEYYGAGWCAPCKLVKPVAEVLCRKYAITLNSHDYDDMEEEEKNTILKLPTIRIFKDGQCIHEITTQHTDQLESWLQNNVRVNTTDDF